MAGFSGRSFLFGIQHLDAASRELFDRHGKGMDGRFSFAEQIAEEAMLRLAGPELHKEPPGVDRHR